MLVLWNDLLEIVPVIHVFNSPNKGMDYIAGELPELLDLSKLISMHCWFIIHKYYMYLTSLLQEYKKNWMS